MYEVRNGAPARVASSARGAADQVRGLNVAGAFGGVQGTLVGSQTEEAVTWLASRLGAAVVVYGDQLASYSRASSQAGLIAQIVDDTVRDQFGARP